MAYGDSVVIKRSSDGKDLWIDDNGRIYVVIASGDIQIGSVEIKDATTTDSVNVRALPSGDNSLVVVGGEVNPLHSSQMNATTQFQYNTSGDLIYIDKVIGITRYRRSTWKQNYTGSQVIDNTQTWTFGSWDIV